MRTRSDANILLVANWKSDVGYAWWLMENFWVAIAEHFSAADIQSHLLYPKITTIPDSIATSSIKTFELDFRDHSPVNFIKLIRFIRKHNIRNIYLTDYPTHSVAYLLLRLTGVRRIVVHDHTPGERTRPSLPLAIIKSFIQRIPYYTADHFIAVSDFVGRRHLEVNKIPRHKCSTVSNGIYPYDIGKTDQLYAHHEFGIDTDKRIIVTTGRASYYKGIDFFIRCANEIVNVQRNRQFHFLFCGDGPDIKDFKSLAQSLMLETHFTFAGRRTDIAEILQSCTAAIHCSTGEVGYSLSILEYMSAGLVTIVPDNPSTSLAITHGKDGILYKPRDITSATEAITDTIDYEKTKELRKNAILTVRNRFNIKNTNHKLVEILDRIYS